MSADSVQLIPLSSIVAGNNDRTRGGFDLSEIKPLAKSIAANGLVQPITVRPCPFPNTSGIEYEIVAGERRFRAHKYLESRYAARCASSRLGLLSFQGIVGLRVHIARTLKVSHIRAIVTHLDNAQASAVMLVENTGRVNLDPIDEAKAYAKRLNEGVDKKQLAAIAGVTSQHITNRVKLLSLREDIQHLVRTGNFQIGYAQILAESSLDNNRQLIALKHLQDNPAPTPVWFRRECSELLGQQAQNDMFADVLFSACDFKATVHKQAFKQQLPPDPKSDKAPMSGKTYREMIDGQIKFWLDAADKWDRYGKSAQRARCEAAAQVLQQIVDVMPSKHGNKGVTRKHENGHTYVVYEAVS